MKQIELELPGQKLLNILIKTLNFIHRDTTKQQWRKYLNFLIALIVKRNN
jgi:hypothetical protein